MADETKILGHTLEEWAPKSPMEGPPLADWWGAYLPLNGYWPWYHTTVEGERVLTVNIIPAGSGSVSINPDKAKYSDGEVVTLLAVPANGYRFDRWEGAAYPDSIYTTVTMNGNKTVTLYYAPLSPLENVSISKIIPGAGYTNQVMLGDWITVGAYVTNIGIEPLYVTVYFKTYFGSNIIHESGSSSKDLAPGESFFFATGHFEDVYANRYDVEVEVYNVEGELLASRKDDGAYYPKMLPQ